MKKKVLFLIHALNAGGGQRVLLELVNNMDYNLFDVTVQTIYDRGELRDKLNPAITYKSILKHINKYSDRLRGYFFRRIANPEWVYKHFIDDGFDYAVAFLEGECTKLISGCSNPNTKTIAWVHCNFMKLFTVNDLFKNTQQHLDTYKKFQTIVCVSNDVADAFVKRFDFDFEDNLTVRYNVIDSNRILKESLAECEYKLSKSVFNIIAVGNMRKEKAYDRLLHICSDLVKAGYIFHLTIIGTGTEINNITALRNELNLNEVVTMLGEQVNPYKYMKQADVLLLASYSEGFSTVLIESIILELPAIVTECSGMNEILDGGKYGIIVPNDTTSINSILQTVIDNPDMLNVYRNRLPHRKDFFAKERSLNEIMKLFSN